VFTPIREDEKKTKALKGKFWEELWGRKQVGVF
jgi:hypothetical protein